MEPFNIDTIKFDEAGLVPVIAQSIETEEVLMLAYMNKEALELTLNTNIAHYYSRSRKSLWKKGETSGHFQHVKSLFYDCDADAILLKVVQEGVACHTGAMSCFHNPVLDAEKTTPILEELYEVLKERKANPKEGSYTTYLFNEGLDKILKKVGEETSEIIIGAKNNDKTNTVNEIADLAYHMMVMMVNEDITLDDVKAALEERRQ